MNKVINKTLMALVPILKMNGENVTNIEAVHDWLNDHPKMEYRSTKQCRRRYKGGGGYTGHCRRTTRRKGASNTDSC